MSYSEPRFTYVRSQTSHVIRTHTIGANHMRYLCSASSYSCMAELALDSHENSAGTFFPAALESDHMGVFLFYFYIYFYCYFYFIFSFY